MIAECLCAFFYLAKIADENDCIIEKQAKIKEVKEAKEEDMIVKVKFDLSDENDAFMYKQLSQSKQMFFSLTEINDMLRSMTKYETLTEEVEDRVDLIRCKFFDILKENGVNLDE